jgi:hypothetical protein
MRSGISKIMMGFSVAVFFCLSGCGGGGSAAPASTPQGGNVTPKIVSGTASEGALIVGKAVKLKDANGKSAVDGVTNAITGIYTIDVTDLAPPFLLTVTGSNGTYVSLAQSAGTANINPITTTVVALAAGNSDVSALFANITPTQLTAINSNYTAKSALVSTSLQSALPTGVKAEDYFTGTISAGTGMDSVFDTYRIAINPATGITVQTKDAAATAVLTISAATVAANTTQALPTINVAPLANAGTVQNVYEGTIVTLDGSGSSDANGDLLTYSWAITSKPLGSSATLSSATTVKPTFTADVAGAYVFNLVVNDGKVNSSKASSVLVIATSNIIKLKINLTGTLPTSENIVGVAFVLNLPAGVVPSSVVNVNNSNASIVQSGLFTAGTNSVIANYNSDAKTMNIMVIDATVAGITQVGEIATVTLKLVVGTAPNIADFSLTAVEVVGSGGKYIAGINASVASVTMQ